MSFKSSVRRSLQLLGQKTGVDFVGAIRRASARLILFLHRSTGVPLMRLALNEQGIQRGSAFDKSGEKFLIEKIVWPHLSENDVIIDVGANTGGYTAQVQRYFKSQRIISYEPNPEAFALLRERGGIEAYQLACSDTKEERKLYFESSNAASTHASFSANEFVTDEPTEYVRVRCVRLDGELNRLEIPQVGLLKIDAEGHDLDVLKGLGAKTESVKFIQFEFNEFHVYTRSFLRDFHSLLSPTHDLFRIDLHTLHDLREYHPYHEIFQYQNIVAVNRTLTPAISKYIKPSA